MWPSKCAALYAICRIGGPINPLICSPTKFCLCSQTTYQPNQPAKFSAHYFLLLLSNGLSLLPIFLPATGLAFCVASAMLAAQAFRVWQHSRYRSTDSRCQSTADHGPQIAQHSTAQLADRTAQHSTAQHGIAHRSNDTCTRICECEHTQRPSQPSWTADIVVCLLATRTP